MGFVFGKGKLKELEMELAGGNSYAARFGETIVDLGDIDDDGHSGLAYIDPIISKFFLFKKRCHLVMGVILIVTFCYILN